MYFEHLFNISFTAEYRYCMCYFQVACNKLMKADDPLSGLAAAAGELMQVKIA